MAFFGFQLPGPFRIGVSSKGRIVGGVSLGPVSVSGTLNRPTPPGGHVLAGTVEQVANAAQAEGWEAVVTPGRSAVITRGFRSARIEQLPGPAVRVTPIASPWTVMLVIGAILLSVVSCCGLLWWTGS